MNGFNQRLLKTMLAASALSLAAEVVAQEQLSAYNWLNITSSSRIYGLGGINISLVDDDLNTTDQNPALLGGEMAGQMSLNYMHYIGGSNFAGVRYASRTGQHSAWAASLQYFGYGSIKETMPDGSILGTFAPKDMSVGFTYSHDITDRLRGGIALKGLYSAYAEYTAFALATDLGLNYFNPDEDTSLSLVLTNLGGQLKRFNETYDHLPFDVRLGASKVFENFPIRFSVTAWNLTRWSLPYVEHGNGQTTASSTTKDTFSSNLFRHLVFGADLISNPNYYLGVGYNYKTRTDMAVYNRNLISGWSLGAGLKGRGFGIGLAMAQPHTGASTIMLNLSLSVNELMNK